jgi:hypothetical protein
MMYSSLQSGIIQPTFLAFVFFIAFYVYTYILNTKMTHYDSTFVADKQELQAPLTLQPRQQHPRKEPPLLDIHQFEAAIASFEHALVVYQKTLDAPRLHQCELEQTIGQLKITIAEQEQVILNLQADKGHLKAENEALMNYNKEIVSMSEIIKEQMRQIAELKQVIQIQQKAIRQQKGNSSYNTQDNS